MIKTKILNNTHKHFSDSLSSLCDGDNDESFDETPISRRKDLLLTSSASSL